MAAPVPHVPSIRELLASAKVSDIPLPGKVVVLSSSQTPAEAFAVLVTERILSAPVRVAGSREYCGILDVRDLISFVVFGETEVAHTNLIEIVGAGEKMYKEAIEGVTVSYMARRNPFHPVKEDASLLAVAEKLAKGTHRVPVVNAEGDVINIISQSSLVKFLIKNQSKLAVDLSRKIAELNIGTTPVMSISSTCSALDAFKILDRTRRSGIAVTDPSGRLLTSTSGQDLKLWLKNPNSGLLKDSILHFLQKIRATEIDITAPVLSIAQGSTLQLALNKLAATRSHRIFVVDKEGRPVRCVSLTDILRQVLKSQ
eukprot:CAMPEP_0174236862 /NCGR_PEP_ID=MMETSP0417-20130205/6233_1 /TAXON_ID=242541 /ORGANISM="Mayorella sp, Strain BSH-02190019" /LENGTH=313 /DNA_ID=CAMNT_0015315559 /DNA_START=51 /DNA_END=992 /DNA_ORIENTATION=+